MKKEIKIFCAENWPASTSASLGGTDYEMLDTGEGEKLERFGSYTFVRPCESAVWKKTLSEKEWARADGKFWSSKVGAKAGWKFKNKIEKKWIMEYKPARHTSQGDVGGGIKFLASPTPFRHLGFFPEQAVHWDFIEEKISRGLSSGTKEKVKFLNLFGYTGVASLFALRAGAEVTHIDASKTSTEWAKENQKINAELAEVPMRIICEDVMKFLEREIKRGNKYDAVIMDPPKFGRGPKGEIWEIEKDLPKLLSQVRKVLSDEPLFVILNSYAIDSSSLSLGYALEDAMKPARNAFSIADAGGGLKGEVFSGELCLLEKSNKRTIPLSNTAIWEKN